MRDTHLMDKGGQMEETLREYFLELGYFVVRGVKYTFEGSEITDVDLWLYQRGSSFSRQRFNVDIKHKRTPRALERVMWAKGLQQCLKLDGALVATTDTQQRVKKFADLNDIVLLDGTLLKKLALRYGKVATRISEEELTYLARGERSDRIGVEWIDRVATAKSRILWQLDFDGFNALLNETRFFASQIISDAQRSVIAYRFFYFTLSLLVVVLDFIVRDFAFIDKQLQANAFNEGFRFGKVGKQGAEKVFAAASKIVSVYSRGERVRGSDLMRQLRTESMDLPVEILTEFFLKANHGRALFDFARSFESLAYTREFRSAVELSAEQRGLIGALLDFHGIDRKRFFDSVPSSSTKHYEPTPKQSESTEGFAEGIEQQREPNIRPNESGSSIVDERVPSEASPLLGDPDSPDGAKTPGPTHDPKQRE